MIEGKKKIKTEVLGMANKLQEYYEKIGYSKNNNIIDFASVSDAKLKSEFQEGIHYVIMQKHLNVSG